MGDWQQIRQLFGNSGEGIGVDSRRRLERYQAHVPVSIMKLSKTKRLLVGIKGELLLDNLLMWNQDIIGFGGIHSFIGFST